MLRSWYDIPMLAAALPPESIAPLLSIVSPCYNEIQSIAQYLEGVEEAAMAAGLAGRFEIVIGDGMSSDGTREWLEEARITRPWLRVVDNPARKTPCGRNAAIVASRGDYVAIVDTHWKLPRDYFSTLLPIAAEPAVGAAGGIYRSLRDGGFTRRLIAAAFESPFGTGSGMRSADGAPTEWIDVENVPGGVLRREVLQQVGLFDQRLWRNQDDEFMSRVRASGLRVVQNRSIGIGYRTRGSLRALFRQYYEYGYYKRYALESPAGWGKAQYLTLLVIVYLVAALLAAFVRPLPALAALALFPCALLVAEMLWRRRAGKLTLPLVVVPVMIMQIAYGVGLWSGLLAGSSHPVAQPPDIPRLEA